MPYEGNLRLIQRIVHMSNYRCVAEQVTSFWSMKSAIHLHESSGSDPAAFDDACEESSDVLQGEHLQHVMQSNSLVGDCTQKETHMLSMSGCQFLRSYRRGVYSIYDGQYCFVGRGGHNLVGRIQGIVVVFVNGLSYVRFHLVDARRCPAPDNERGGVMTINAWETTREDVVKPILFAAETCIFFECHSQLSSAGVYTFTFI